MSSRALKRLERQKLESKLQSDEENESSDNEPQPSSRFNAFAFLGDAEDEEDDDDDDDDDEVEQVEKKIQPAKEKSPSKKTNKGKKESKGKKAKKIEVDSDEELDRILEAAKASDKKKAKKRVNTKIDTKEEIPEDVYDYEEELDMEVKPVKDYDSNFKHFTSKRLKQSFPLLSVGSIKSLDPDQEFRNLFGNLSLETIEDANTTTSLAISPEMLQQFKKLARLTRGWAGKDRRGVPGTTRKLLLTRIRDDWLPTAQKPMDMKELTQQQVFEYMDYKEQTATSEELELKIAKEFNLGVRYFTFEKINNIQQRVANTRFYAAVVMTPDPESLMHLLQQYPYHAETLLQVAMVLLRQGSEKSTSSSLIEKALFVFDRSLQKRLHELLLEGRSELVRLPYESFANRQFYLCLFRYITALGERRTFVTALSYCKFLLSLSPAEDPLGVRYLIDFYAMMSEEYKYMVNFAESPLATTYEKWFTPGIAFSAALAHLKLGDQSSAKKSLQLAYSKHPYTAYKLLELIGLSGKLPIRESDLNPSSSVLVEAETYLIRAALMWDDQAHRQFLHDELTELFEKQSPKSSSSIYSLLGIGSAPATDKDIPINLIRFTILSGESKIMARLPEQVWKMDSIFEYDVLPPQDTSVQYNEFTGASSGTGVVDTLINHIDHNLLGTIIQSRSGEDQFDDLMDQLRGEQPEEPEE